MQKLCCVRTRQHSLPVWIISSQVHHRISTNSQPFLVGIVSLAEAMIDCHTMASDCVQFENVHQRTKIGSFLHRGSDVFVVATAIAGSFWSSITHTLLTPPKIEFFLPR